MWFTVGVAVSCGICALLFQTGLLPVILVSAVLLLTGLFGGRKRKALRALTAVGIGCAAGLLCFSAFDAHYLSCAREMNETEASVIITASDFSYETDYGIAVDGILMVEDKPYQLRVYLDAGSELFPGDQISGVFRFRVTTREGLDSHHPGKGIFLMAYQRGDATLQKAGKQPWWCFPALLRQEIKEILARSFPEDVFPFVKALLLGDSHDLGYETDTALKISGIRHIVAVSGLHVSILYGLIGFISLKKRFLTALLGIPTLVLFAAVAGFTPSVCRACVMIGVMILSQLLDREYDPPTALSFAVLLMLVMNPLVITSAGFQLSVGSVAGILLFQSGIFNWARTLIAAKKTRSAKRWSGIAASISVTISASSLTIPLSAFYFNTVSFISFLTNFLTLWLVELVFIGILVICVASLVSGTLAAVLGMVIAWPIRGILAVSKLLSRLPLSAVYTESIYIAAWLVFVYILIAIFLFGGRKEPLRVFSCGILSLCLALGLSWAEPLLYNCSVTMLDVGQGQCVILQSEGRTWLVDCGGDSGEAAANLAVETLLSQGITQLDGVIVTHYDDDHFAGVPYLLSRMETDLLMLPDTLDNGKCGHLPEISGKILYIDEDVELSFGSSHLRIYGPVYSGYSNENSLCVLFDTEKCDILITGDRSAFGERMLLRENNLPDVDVLIAGHHGAGDSTSEVLLQAVKPEAVLISVAQDNSYGHPHGDTLRRLSDFGCTVYRTDLHGTILYRR